LRPALLLLPLLLLRPIPLQHLLELLLGSKHPLQSSPLTAVAVVVAEPVALALLLLLHASLQPPLQQPPLLALAPTPLLRLLVLMVLWKMLLELKMAPQPHA
jgi:hypothetical protein